MENTSSNALTAIADCRNGRMMYLRHDLYVGRSLEVYGEFSELEAQIFRELIRPNDLVVDVGANIGAHTIEFARLVGPGGSVVAFEPQRVVFQILCANVAMNETFNVRTFHAAAGKQPEMLVVPPLDYDIDYNFGGISLHNYVGGEPVQVLPLDALNLKSVRLIKIDVEGMEIDVLEGARQLIAEYRPILYVENDRRENSSELISLITELGYQMWWHLTPLFNPDNFRKTTTNVFGDTGSTNMLCLPFESVASVKNLTKVSSPDDWPKNIRPADEAKS